MQAQQEDDAEDEQDEPAEQATAGARAIGHCDQGLGPVYGGGGTTGGTPGGGGGTPGVTGGTGTTWPSMGATAEARLSNPNTTKIIGQVLRKAK